MPNTAKKLDEGIALYLYLRDIINRYSVQDEAALGEVMDVIASGISTLTNPRKIASTMNSVHGTTTCDATVDRYIGYAEEAFMLTRVKRYNVKGRKYIGTPYKIYFEDVGLRNARLSFRQIEGTHIMENIIYNELRYRGYQVEKNIISSLRMLFPVRRSINRKRCPLNV